MASYPTPNFELNIYNSLSTKKERKILFSNFGRPPKLPVRSCPIPRIYSVVKEDAPHPISFREDSDISFITDSPLYRRRKGAYFEQCYRILETLGRGAFGEVFKVVNRENGFEYACKKNILQFRGIEDRTRRIEEVKKHEQLHSHVNIVKFYRAWEENNHLYLLTEVCKYSLADILVNNHEFPESRLWTYLTDILQGLDHLHKHKLIHMDVKPENIFIGMDGRCKLGDFGLSIDFSKGYPKEGTDGDPRYLAPECLQLVYTPAADIFSLGIVMLEIATDLYLPQAGPTWHDLRNGNIPSMDSRGLSTDFQATIRRLLEPDHMKRIAAEEALNLKTIKRVILKNNFYNFLRSKVRNANFFLGTVLLFPIMFLSYFASLFKRHLLGFKSPLRIENKRKCTPDGSFDNIDVIDVDVIERTRFLPSAKGKLRESVEYPYNSTPKSHSKRKIFTKDQQHQLKRDGDDIDGSKYSFNESSFSSLDLSRDPSIPSLSDSRLSATQDVTARNLLDLFNNAELSEDES